MAESVFARDGERVVATELAQGPWDPRHCHAGAPAALAAALVEGVAALVPMLTVRLTFEIRKPVPIGVPLAPTVTITRDGRRVQTVAADLRLPDGDAILHVQAQRIRRAEASEGLPTVADPEPTMTPGPEGIARWPQGEVDGGGAWRFGFVEAVDVRIVAGAVAAPGPGRAWFRLSVPVLPDVPITGLQRAAAAADFGNGISSPLTLEEHLFINPDLTLTLHREPVGEWVGLDAVSVVQPHGTGLTISAVHDEHGRIGQALQTLYVASR